jgi:antitoxin component of MazEF toxin-antitoxin module
LTKYIHVVYTYVKESEVVNVNTASVVSKWGNSKGIRVPAEVLKKAHVDVNDKLYFDVDQNGRIIMTKEPTPEPGTLEYLFKDYEGGSFATELNDLGGPVGNEKW